MYCIFSSKLLLLASLICAGIAVDADADSRTFSTLSSSSEEGKNGGIVNNVVNNLVNDEDHPTSASASEPLAVANSCKKGMIARTQAALTTSEDAPLSSPSVVVLDKNRMLQTTSTGIDLTCNSEGNAVAACANNTLSPQDNLDCGACIVNAQNSTEAQAQIRASNYTCAAYTKFVCDALTACPCADPCATEVINYQECLLLAIYSQAGVNFDCNINCDSGSGSGGGSTGGGSGGGGGGTTSGGGAEPKTAATAGAMTMTMAALIVFA